MPAPPSKSTLFPTGALAPATAKTGFEALYDYIVGLLGATGNASDARTALGAAADSAVIKTTGDQTKAGVLTFSSSPVLPGNASANLQAVPKQQLDAAVAASALSSALSVYLGEVNTTSGTSHQLIGIPAWATRVEVEAVGVSISSPGSDPFGFQVGNASSWAIAGYSGGASMGTSTSANSSGFLAVPDATHPSFWTGSLVLTRARADDTTWVYRGQFARTDSAAVLRIAAGQVTISDLDRIRIAMLGGTSLFDGGYIRGRAGI